MVDLGELNPTVAAGENSEMGMFPMLLILHGLRLGAQSWAGNVTRALLQFSWYLC